MEDELEDGYLNQFALLNTTNATSGDFLKMSIAHYSNRVGLYFVTGIRNYLGLPVTKLTCNLDRCENVKVWGNSSHTHGNGMETRRHTLIKEVILSCLKPLSTSKFRRFVVGAEMPMENLGFSVRTGFARPKRLICDIYTTNVETHHVQAGDVVCSQPNPEKEEHWQGGFVAKKAAEGKVVDYAPWSIDPKDFKPLSFTTLGEWDTKTLDYLKNKAEAMA